MKRVCFDIGSNYFYNGLYGFMNEPSQARCYFEDKTFKFYAATAFDSSSRRFRDFTDYKKLFAYLLKADEMITFNGRTCDFIVLERLVGTEAMRSLWKKPHHDLRGWGGEFKLASAVSEFLPNIKASFDTVQSNRLDQIRKSYGNEFIAEHLANTYRDTKFTWVLFQKYLASGSSEHTFHND
jgi:hypothetical protein